MTARSLSFHAQYRCQQTGACCRAGWHLPIEPAVLAALRAALDTGRLTVARPPAGETFLTVEDPPPDVGAVLGADTRGDCIFVDATNRCHIHHALGAERLPSACRQFPRVTVLTPASASVSLSHYCPTAARLLVESTQPVSIVEAPPDLVPPGGLEGLDMRESYPPLLRPGTLMNWEEFERWERHMVHTIARDDLSPEQALHVLDEDAASLEAWTPHDGPLMAHVERVATRRAAMRFDTLSVPVDLRLAVRLHGLVRRAIPDALPSHRAIPMPQDVPRLADLWIRVMRDRWAAFRGPVRRYLSARAFASWCAHQGSGVRASVVAVTCAWAVLVVEAARLANRTTSAFTTETLIEAVRAADLMLIHLAAPDALADLIDEATGDARAEQR